MLPQIELRGVTKEFGKNIILDKVDLKIPPRKIFGIIGESGSGKTTLLKTLIGYWKPDDGDIFYDGRDLKKDLKYIKQVVGFATQDNCVYPKLTVRENLEYFGAMCNVPNSTLQRNIDKILDLVELKNADNKLAEELSGGMQRRLDIACALMHNPKILILDEPTEDLDPLLRRDIVELIKKINENDTTIIHDGRILEYGPTDELKDRYSKNEEVHVITRGKKYKEIVRKLGKNNIERAIVEGNTLVLQSKNAEALLPHVLRAVEDTDKLIEVDLKKPTLTEVFESLVRKARQTKKEV